MEVERFKAELWNIIKISKLAMETLFDPICEKLGLTRVQLKILCGIEMGEFSTIGGLSNNLGLNQGNASTFCKKMEQQGYIKRSRSGDDERVVLLTVTENGREVLNKLHHAAGAIFDEMAGTLSQTQIERIVLCFADLQEALIAINEKYKK